MPVSARDRTFYGRRHECLFRRPDTVAASLLGIYKTLYSSSDPATIFMLQEVDKNSSRTYGKDEAYALGINNSTYALNYSCKFVPYPCRLSAG